MLPVCKYAILILIISILLLHFRLPSPANIHQRLLQFLRPEGMSILIVLSMYSNHYTQQVYTCKFKRLFITSYFFLFSPPVSLFLSLSLPLSFYLSLFLSLSFSIYLPHSPAGAYLLECILHYRASLWGILFLCEY